MCSASPSRKPATSRSRSASEGNTRPRKMSRWRSAGTPETEATLAFNAAMEAWCFGSNQKRASVVASFAASFPTKKKEKKKAFDEEKNDDDARGKVWKARAADATGRGGRDARRWEATSCVRPRAPAAARARGSWPPRRRAASGWEPRRSPSRRPIAFHFGSDVTSVPACPPSPFAFAFDLFDRVAPTSTNRVRSTRRRSCAARVPSRADECAPRGVRALTKRSRAGEKSKKPKTRKISIVAISLKKKKWAPKSSRAFGVI